MSERMVVNAQPETQIPPLQHLGPEAGAINVGELKSRGEEIARDVLDRGKLAYHGLRVAIAKRRIESAGSTMAEMDHKKALVADLGYLALNGKRPDTPSDTRDRNPAKPRNLGERFLDKSIDKRGHKKMVADTYAYRALKIYGDGDSLPGLSKQQKRLRKAGAGFAQLSGRASARNARMAQLRIAAEKPKYGEHMHRNTAKGVRKQDKRFENVASTKRYDKNRDMAIDTIRNQHIKVEKHRARKEEIQAERAARGALHIKTPQEVLNSAARASGRKVGAVKKNYRARKKAWDRQQALNRRGVV